MKRKGARDLLAVTVVLAVGQGCRCSARTEAEVPAAPASSTPQAPVPPASARPVRIAATAEPAQTGADETWARVAATWQSARALLAQPPAGFGTRELMSALSRLSDAQTDVETLAARGTLSAGDAALLRLGLKVLREAEGELAVGTDSDPPTADQVVAQLRQYVPDLQDFADRGDLRPDISRQVGAVVNQRVTEARRLMDGRAAATDKSLTETLDMVHALAAQMSSPPAPSVSPSRPDADLNPVE